MDISDEMIRVARRTSQELENILFVAGEVEKFPGKRISSRTPFRWNLVLLAGARGRCKELFRVAARRPNLILINYYKDNPHCHQWGELRFAVKTHLLCGRVERTISRSGVCGSRIRTRD